MEFLDVGLSGLDMLLVVSVLTGACTIPDDAKFEGANPPLLSTLRDYINTSKDPQSMGDVMEFA